METPTKQKSAYSLAIVYRSIAKLKLDPNNPRLHTKKQIRQIARSIKAFGFNVPVLIDKKGRIIAGHGRVLAARLLGITHIPTICLEDLSDAQIRAFMIAENQLTLNGAWDERLLAQQFKALSEVELDFSLEATGFEMAEIDLMIEGLAPAAEGDEDPADALPEVAAGIRLSQPGDLWLLDRHRVLCGDALRGESYTSVMEGQLATVVFTDPPYNSPIDGYVTGFGKIHHPEFAMASGEMSEAEFTDFLTQVLTHLAGNSVDGALHFICMDWRHANEMLTAGRQAYTEMKNICVWVKENAGQGSLYRSQHELVFVFKIGTGPHRNNIQLGQYGRYRSNVWSYPRVNSLSHASQEGNLSHLHPTIKPVEMVADAILDCTARGDIVLDAFLGSGTTVIAAERTGRVCYGLELDPGYLDTTIRRWQAFTGKSAVHANSGKKFHELEEEVRGAQKN